MSACTRPFFHTRALCLAVLAAGMVFTAYAQAQVALTQLSTDTFTDTPSQHETEVEPGTFSYGSTIVSAFQVARIYSGGGADIGFATSTDAGTSWTNGYLPGITIYQGGTHSAASDAAVAYDAMHGVWLIATLPIASNTSVAVSRSADGLTWGDPITIKGSASADKNWIVCDNTSTSPYYGHCYAEWDNTNDGDLIQMSTSTDGGQTWGSVMATAAQDYGIGGVPVVQPKGIVIVPILGFAGNGEVTAYTSTNGGASWTKAVNVASYTSHAEAGTLRSGGLVTSAIDAAGKVYVFWPDCRFRVGCTSNDIVYSTSSNGTKWSAVKRVPIDAVSSTVDHFITGTAIAPGTKGAKAQIALVYYFYPVSKCGSDCSLNVGFVQSSTGGSKWTAPETLAGPMELPWLPETFSGTMVADYVSVGFGGGKVFPVFATAQAKAGSLFHEAIYTTASGLKASTPETELMSADGDRPVPNAHSDHGPMEYLDQEHEIPRSGKRPPERD
ncbi:MAG: sialidase family protein [Terriglobales bacterium]